MTTYLCQVPSSLARPLMGTRLTSGWILYLEGGGRVYYVPLGGGRVYSVPGGVVGYASVLDCKATVPWWVGGGDLGGEVAGVHSLLPDSHQVLQGGVEQGAESVLPSVPAWDCIGDHLDESNQGVVQLKEPPCSLGDILIAELQISQTPQSSY